MLRFERRFLDKDEIVDGPISSRHCNKLWILFSLLLLGSLYFTELTQHQTILYACLAPIFARLIAIDLCYFILPNIYTLPLIITGIIHTLCFNEAMTILESLYGILGAVLLLFVSYFLERVSKKQLMGMGDINLTAAAGAFISIQMLPVFLWIACAIVLIFYPILKKKKSYISFGPALALSLWVLLTFPNIVEKTLSFWI